MAIVRPFRGTRYNTERIGDLATVLAPPYDVISEPMREALMARSPHSVVRIDFGPDQPGDDELNNRHTRAAALLADWRREGVLIDDPEPCLYICAQDYTLPNGQSVTRVGIFAAVELMELGPQGVMPHERTFEGPKADRLNLTRATNANSSAIFALFADDEGHVTRLLADHIADNAPAAQGSTDDGVTHRVWVVADKGLVQDIQRVLAGRPLYIADGHHRYETALNYAAEQRRGDKAPDSKPRASDHTLMFLVSTEDPGLVILPTHRVLRADLVTDLPAFCQAISRHFELAPLHGNWEADETAASSIQMKLAEAGERTTAYAMLLPGGEATLLTLRPEADLGAMIPEPMPQEKRALDVTILHAHVLDRCWLAGREVDLDEERCRYVRDVGEAMNLVRRGTGCVAFLMNATSLEQLKAISALGERMPQKSTYFFPKIATGIVLRDMSLPLD